MKIKHNKYTGFQDAEFFYTDNRDFYLIVKRR